MHKTILALIVVFLALLFVGVFSYSTFLQIPVFKGYPLKWQSIVEQFTFWIPAALAYLYLFKAITARQKVKKELINENKLLIPAVMLIYISALSIGIHAASSIVEDYLVNSPNTMLFSIVMFMDETVGHIFLVLFPIFLLIFCFLELNRKKSKLNKYEKIIIYVLSIINGFLWGIAGVEGGSMYVAAVPITIGACLYLASFIKKQDIKIINYPFTLYFLLSSVVMVIATLFWVFKFGFFTQPGFLGVELLSL